MTLLAIPWSRIRACPDWSAWSRLYWMLFCAIPYGTSLIATHYKDVSTCVKFGVLRGIFEVSKPCERLLSYHASRSVFNCVRALSVPSDSIIVTPWFGASCHFASCQSFSVCQFCMYVCILYSCTVRVSVGNACRLYIQQPTRFTFHLTPV